jgi:hypothetical protein
MIDAEPIALSLPNPGGFLVSAAARSGRDFNFFEK